MGFRLVPKLVTLIDHERRNGPYFCVILPNSVALGPITSKWLKIVRYCLRKKCSPRNLVFSDISFTAIFAEVTENECSILSAVRSYIVGRS